MEHNRGVLKESFDVLVVGAGGGIDVEAALLSGARHVDAVEIDRQMVNLSRRFNASGVYDDPRVAIHIDDARAFFWDAATVRSEHHLPLPLVPFRRLWQPQT